MEDPAALANLNIKSSDCSSPSESSAGARASSEVEQSNERAMASNARESRRAMERARASSQGCRCERGKFPSHFQHGHPSERGIGNIFPKSQYCGNSNVVDSRQRLRWKHKNDQKKGY